MQFCSKSELHQSIKTCNCFSAEQAPAASNSDNNNNSSNSNHHNAGSHHHGAGRHATIFSANIDPPSCASQYDFPCWSSSSPDLRRALQNDLPDDWQELLKIPAFRVSVAKQTFFDRPDTSKLSTLLAGIQGGGARSKDNDGGAGGEEDSDAEPVVSFAELFRKRPVPGVDDAGGVNEHAETSESKQSSEVAEHEGAPPDGRSAFELDEETSEPADVVVTTPTKTQVPEPQNDAANLTDEANATHPFHSGLHQLLFGSDQGAKASEGNSANAAGNTGTRTATATSQSTGAGGSDGSPRQGMTTIDVYLPDPSRTKIELRVAPTYSMSRTIKLLLAQAAVRAALGPLPEHQDLHPAHYELKLHDEDGIALDMAHNLGDKTVAETGEVSSAFCLGADQLLAFEQFAPQRIFLLLTCRLFLNVQGRVCSPAKTWGADGGHRWCCCINRDVHFRRRRGPGRSNQSPWFCTLVSHIAAGVAWNQSLVFGSPQRRAAKVQVFRFSVWSGIAPLVSKIAVDWCDSRWGRIRVSAPIGRHQASGASEWAAKIDNSSQRACATGRARN